MIVCPNIPKSVQHLACIQLEIDKCEKRIHLLYSGDFVSYKLFCIRKTLVGRQGRVGKKKFLMEYVRPEITRLKQRSLKCRVVSTRLCKKLGMPLEHWLLSKNEMLSMIGSTLFFHVSCNNVYDTIQGCSEDGEKLYTSSGRILDSLSLLSLGFGKEETRSGSFSNHVHSDVIP